MEVPVVAGDVDRAVRRDGGGRVDVAG
jgi:hypothetical protein